MGQINVKQIIIGSAAVVGFVSISHARTMAQIRIGVVAPSDPGEQLLDLIDTFLLAAGSDLLVDGKCEIPPSRLLHTESTGEWIV